MYCDEHVINNFVFETVIDEYARGGRKKNRMVDVVAQRDECCLLTLRTNLFWSVHLDE